MQEMSFKYYMYSVFNKILKRDYPCGRRKKDRNLACRRPINKETCYLSQDGTKAYCRYCNKLRVISDAPIDLDNLFGDEEALRRPPA